MSISSATAAQVQPLPSSQQTTESAPQTCIQRAVQWLKKPGEYETIRKAIAVVAAVLLSLTIIGIPVVILAYREWNKVTPPAPAAPQPPTPLPTTTSLQEPAPQPLNPVTISLQEPTRLPSPAERALIAEQLPWMNLDNIRYELLGDALMWAHAARREQILNIWAQCRTIVQNEEHQRLREMQAAGTFTADAFQWMRAQRDAKVERINAVKEEIDTAINAAPDVLVANQRMHEGKARLQLLMRELMGRDHSFAFIGRFA